jgi:hypothetical protein
MPQVMPQVIDEGTNEGTIEGGGVSDIPPTKSRIRLEDIKKTKL